MTKCSFNPKLEGALAAEDDLAILGLQSEIELLILGALREFKHDPGGGAVDSWLVTIVLFLISCLYDTRAS